MKITTKLACGLLVFAALISQKATAQKKVKEKNVSAYLMVYFKDETHGLYMALSKDGYSFTDINNGKPIMSGDTIALQKGIRDPHIMRGPDGAFYLAMTDLHLFAEKVGFRNTQWERDKSFGWGNNRSMVLMKSWDLMNWSHSIVRVDQAFPGLDSIGCAWAPETIYDKKQKKMMIYFTMRFKNGKNKIYYSYTDNDFTKLETAPQLLFTYPKDISYIDADITQVGKKYHLFYVPHDGTPGIKQVASKSINKGYVYDPKYYDPEPKACEAPTVFKRIGEKKWVLIYDIYGITPHNFGFSETCDFVSFKDIGHFNEGVMKSTNFSSPKHGAVVHLTKKEADALAKKWNLNSWFN
jgi:hypothetical protein